MPVLRPDRHCHFIRNREITVASGLGARDIARRVSTPVNRLVEDTDVYQSARPGYRYYRLEDHAARVAASRYSGAHVVGPDPSKGPMTHNTPTRFAVPVLVLQGRLDLYTSWITAKSWFDAVHAPRKTFITFERSAHFPFFDEPGRFLTTLVQQVRPLAKEGAPFAPMPGTPR
jgi:pimeloyl-ACP methyl ester carboxylesterase